MSCTRFNPESIRWMVVQMAWRANVLWAVSAYWQTENPFCATPGVAQGGLPLGNLTSQLLVNIYMNEFDQFAKHTLKARCYVRYADDFVVLSPNRPLLESLRSRISTFLKDRLSLELHPNKVSIRTLASGIDFLGWVHFSDHRVLRTSTKKRMFKALSGNSNEATAASYRGMLSHGNAQKLQLGVPQLPANGR